MVSKRLSDPPQRRSYGGMSAAERDVLRHERLVDAGLELFGTVGYAGASIESLCAAAGVSTRNFYDHFESREDVLVAVYERITEDAQTAILEAVKVPGLDMEHQARAGIEAFVDSILSDERRARVNFIEVIGASRRVEARRREVIRSFAAIIEIYARELMHDGVIPSRDPHVGALGLIGAVQEVLSDWVTGSERPPLEPIVLELVRLFLAAASG